MARVTVEDCFEKIGNQFELTLVAAKRARQLTRGANAHVDWDTDKSTVVSLREIADGKITKDVLNEEDLPIVPRVKVDLQNLDPGPES